MNRRVDKSRRRFLEASGAAGFAAWLSGCTGEDVNLDGRAAYAPSERLRSFTNILAKPVLERQYLPDPVVIENIGIFRNGRHTFIKVTSADGAS